MIISGKQILIYALSVFSLLKWDYVVLDIIIRNNKPPPPRNDDGAKKQKRATLASLNWEGEEEGWSRRSIYFVQDCSLQVRFWRGIFPNASIVNTFLLIFPARVPISSQLQVNTEKLICSIFQETCTE